MPHLNSYALLINSLKFIVSLPILTIVLTLVLGLNFNSDLLIALLFEKAIYFILGGNIIKSKAFLSDLHINLLYILSTLKRT